MESLTDRQARYAREKVKVASIIAESNLGDIIFAEGFISRQQHIVAPKEINPFDEAVCNYGQHAEGHMEVIAPDKVGEDGIGGVGVEVTVQHDGRITFHSCLFKVPIIPWNYHIGAKEWKSDKNALRLALTRAMKTPLFLLAGQFLRSSSLLDQTLNSF